MLIIKLYLLKYFKIKLKLLLCLRMFKKDYKIGVDIVMMNKILNLMNYILKIFFK